MTDMTCLAYDMPYDYATSSSKPRIPDSSLVVGGFDYGQEIWDVSMQPSQQLDQTRATSSTFTVLTGRPAEMQTLKTLRSLESPGGWQLLSTRLAIAAGGVKDSLATYEPSVSDKCSMVSHAEPQRFPAPPLNE